MKVTIDGDLAQHAEPAATRTKAMAARIIGRQVGLEKRDLVEHLAGDRI